MTDVRPTSVDLSARRACASALPRIRNSFRQDRSIVLTQAVHRNLQNFSRTAWRTSVYTHRRGFISLCATSKDLDSFHSIMPRCQSPCMAP